MLSSINLHGCIASAYYIALSIPGFNLLSIDSTIIGIQINSIGDNPHIAILLADIALAASNTQIYDAGYAGAASQRIIADNSLKTILNRHSGAHIAKNHISLSQISRIDSYINGVLAQEALVRHGMHCTHIYSITSGNTDILHIFGGNKIDIAAIQATTALDNGAAIGSQVNSALLQSIGHNLVSILNLIELGIADIASEVQIFIGSDIDSTIFSTTAYKANTNTLVRLHTSVIGIEGTLGFGPNNLIMLMEAPQTSLIATFRFLDNGWFIKLLRRNRHLIARDTILTNSNTAISISSIRSATTQIYFLPFPISQLALGSAIIPQSPATIYIVNLVAVIGCRLFARGPAIA